MAMLRRLPRILRYVPGKAQDLRAWFLTMQYWLGGSDDNIEQMIRFLLSRYASETRLAGGRGGGAGRVPALGLYHPDLPERITADAAKLPAREGAVATVGLLMMRTYVLAGDTAHYDAVIRRLRGAGTARGAGLRRRARRAAGDGARISAAAGSTRWSR